MFIIKTFKCDVKIDSDELQKLIDNSDSKLIFFRQGAVNPAHIVAVVEDADRRAEILKLAGESEHARKMRMDSDRSEDIFETVRQVVIEGKPRATLMGTSK